MCEYFNSKNQVEQLIQAVARLYPRNERIRAMLERLGAATDTGEFEQVVRQAFPFMDIEVWRRASASLNGVFAGCR